MHKLGAITDAQHVPVVSQSAPSTHSRIPTIDQSAVKVQQSSLLDNAEPSLRSTENLQSIVDEYRQEVQTFGR